MKIIVLIFLFLLSSFSVNTAATTQAYSSSANAWEMLAGRKTVTAYADNETEAVARAENANPGWKAISAEKTSDDPKSRAWRVTMVSK